MTYLSGRSKKRKTYVIYALLSCVFLLVVVFWTVVRKQTYTVLEPLVVKTSTVKQSFTFFPEFFSTYISSRQKLNAEKNDLMAQVEQLENEVSKKDAQLRMLGLTDSMTTTGSSTASPYVMYPLLQDITKLYSTVLLSLGFKDGISIDDIVYIRGNQAVCSIKEVYKSSSLCLLFTSSGVVTEGVTSSSSIVVTLKGRGGHYLADVPRETPVTVGEKVYLRSNPAMVLGTIQTVVTNNQDTSWHVFVEGAYNPVTTSVFYVQP